MGLRPGWVKPKSEIVGLKPGWVKPKTEIVGLRPGWVKPKTEIGICCCSSHCIKGQEQIG